MLLAAEWESWDGLRKVACNTVMGSLVLVLKEDALFGTGEKVKKKHPSFDTSVCHCRSENFDQACKRNHSIGLSRVEPKIKSRKRMEYVKCVHESLASTKGVVSGRRLFSLPVFLFLGMSDEKYLCPHTYTYVWRHCLESSKENCESTMSGSPGSEEQNMKGSNLCAGAFSEKSV